MNSDLSLYLAGVAAAGLGGWLAIRKRRNADARVLRPWLRWSCAIAAVVWGVLAVSAVFIEKSSSSQMNSKDVIGAVFGFGLVLQGVLTVSGVILVASRLIHISTAARRDME
jgi:LPXTG-motif cell wall-anchored protein